MLASQGEWTESVIFLSFIISFEAGFRCFHGVRLCVFLLQWNVGELCMLPSLHVSTHTVQPSRRASLPRHAGTREQYDRNVWRWDSTCLNTDPPPRQDELNAHCFHHVTFQDVSRTFSMIWYLNRSEFKLKQLKTGLKFNRKRVSDAWTTSSSTKDALFNSLFISFKCFQSLRKMKNPETNVQNKYLTLIIYVPFRFFFFLFLFEKKMLRLHFPSCIILHKVCMEPLCFCLSLYFGESSLCKQTSADHRWYWRKAVRKKWISNKERGFVGLCEQSWQHSEGLWWETLVFFKQTEVKLCHSPKPDVFMAFTDFLILCRTDLSTSRTWGGQSQRGHRDQTGSGLSSNAGEVYVQFQQQLWRFRFFFPLK